MIVFATKSIRTEEFIKTFQSKKVKQKVFIRTRQISEIKVSREKSDPVIILCILGGFVQITFEMRSIFTPN